uniref:BACK domain-containing protein n=1 Tax=Panagrolaimus sp. PS1159 TaxID=55785 RepID=A0AC35F7C9_9BILA
DMAEFYAVPFLKEFCEKFLMKMEYNIESIEEMFDFSQKYSVSNMKQELKRYIRSNIGEVTSTERLLSYKKPFVDFLFSTDSDKGKHFEAVYKWTEHQVLEQHDPEDKSFNLLEAVKAELRETFPQIFSIDGIWWEYDFKTRMEYDFLMNFVIEKAEKQALQKQKMSSDAETFNIADCIKADLIEVIPNASFNRMEKSFLMNFVVAKGIITEEQANHVSDTRSKIFLSLFDE